MLNVILGRLEVHEKERERGGGGEKDSVCMFLFTVAMVK